MSKRQSKWEMHPMLLKSTRLRCLTLSRGISTSPSTSFWPTWSLMPPMTKLRTISLRMITVSSGSPMPQRSFPRTWWTLLCGWLMIPRFSPSSSRRKILDLILLLTSPRRACQFCCQGSANGEIRVKFYDYSEVLLMIEPSSKFSHLYIRAGKIVAAVSLSIRFVVNVTGTVD